MNILKKVLLGLLAIALLLPVSNSFAEEQSKTVKVLIETTRGNIELELYPQKAPETVANFLRYVDEGFYEGTIFHRVINSFMIQGGGFDAGMKKKSTHKSIKNEAGNGLTNDRGTIAMARTGEPHSATSQFFINHIDNDFLNFKSPDQRGWGYCVFGRVTDGMKTVDTIADLFTKRVNGMQNVPEQTVMIKKITRL